MFFNNDVWLRTLQCSIVSVIDLIYSRSYPVTYTVESLLCMVYQFSWILCTELIHKIKNSTSICPNILHTQMYLLTMPGIHEFRYPRNYNFSRNHEIVIYEFKWIHRRHYLLARFLFCFLFFKNNSKYSVKLFCIWYPFRYSRVSLFRHRICDALLLSRNKRLVPS